MDHELEEAASAPVVHVRARRTRKTHSPTPLCGFRILGQELLKSKVSRERIGIEVKKMLSGALSSLYCWKPQKLLHLAEGETPVESLRLLCKWGLRDVVFRTPDNMGTLRPAAVHFVTHIALPSSPLRPLAR